MISLSSALICLAMTVYHESRDQPEYVQFRVAQTVMHRTVQSNKEICSVVRKPAQFSWVQEGRYGKTPHEKAAWRKALKIAKLTMNGHYVNVDTVPDHFWSKENGKEFTPKWAWACKWKERVKDMTFCRINPRKDPEVKKVIKPNYIEQFTIVATNGNDYKLVAKKTNEPVKQVPQEQKDPLFALLLLRSFLGGVL